MNQCCHDMARFLKHKRRHELLTHPTFSRVCKWNSIKGEKRSQLPTAGCRAIKTNCLFSTERKSAKFERYFLLDEKHILSGLLNDLVRGGGRCTTITLSLFSLKQLISSNLSAIREFNVSFLAVKILHLVILLLLSDLIIFNEFCTIYDTDFWLF